MVKIAIDMSIDGAADALILARRRPNNRTSRELDMEFSVDGNTNAMEYVNDPS